MFLYAVFKVQSSILRISKDPSGEYEIRTRDLLLARQALSQLSYTPKWYVSIFTLSMGLSGPYLLSLILKDLGLSGLEPPTSRLSGVRSNQLSYKPIFFCNLAATYSPTPSPVQYHRPLRSLPSCSGWERVLPLSASPPKVLVT